MGRGSRRKVVIIIEMAETAATGLRQLFTDGHYFASGLIQAVGGDSRGDESRNGCVKKLSRGDKFDIRIRRSHHHHYC